MRFNVVFGLRQVNFMAPFVDNDHSIHYPVDDSVYAAYGPLFAELRSLQWVLAAHAVVVKDNAAEANFFHTKTGFAATIVFPSSSSNSTSKVMVTLRGVRKPTTATAAAAAASGGAQPPQPVGVTVSVLHPGGGEPEAAAFTWGADGGLTVEVALGGPDPANPCAMVLVKDALNPPRAQPQPRDYY